MKFPAKHCVVELLGPNKARCFCWVGNELLGHWCDQPASVRVHYETGAPDQLCIDCWDRNRSRRAGELSVAEMRKAEQESKC